MIQTEGLVGKRVPNKFERQIQICYRRQRFNKYLDNLISGEGKSFFEILPLYHADGDRQNCPLEFRIGCSGVQSLSEEGSLEIASYEAMKYHWALSSLRLDESMKEDVLCRLREIARGGL